MKGDSSLQKMTPPAINTAPLMKSDPSPLQLMDGNQHGGDSESTHPQREKAHQRPVSQTGLQPTVFEVSHVAGAGAVAVVPTAVGSHASPTAIAAPKAVVSTASSHTVTWSAWLRTWSLWRILTVLVLAVLSCEAAGRLIRIAIGWQRQWSPSIVAAPGHTSFPHPCTRQRRRRGGKRGDYFSATPQEDVDFGDDFSDDIDERYVYDDAECMSGLDGTQRDFKEDSAQKIDHGHCGFSPRLSPHGFVRMPGRSVGPPRGVRKWDRVAPPAGYRR